MPVRWHLTERAVMDHPQLIMTSPLSFDGHGDRINALAAAFRQLKHRRLVILGGPGSGKTTLAVQLLLELLIATRQPDEPIPVLVSLSRWESIPKSLSDSVEPDGVELVSISQWEPTQQPQLHSWLADRLAEDYPSLRAFGADVAHTLVKQGKILPILDGLDELPRPRQSEIIAALNASLTETDQLILTSRTQEYESAIGEANNVLTAAAVIEPEPLSPDQAADYLAACLPPDTSPSWQEILDRLRAGTAGHLATVLTTPLGLWLLRTVYITPGTDPAALLNSAALRNPTAMQAELFDRLIPALLATRPASRNSIDSFRPRRTWNAQDVRKWLIYLARHLHQSGTRDLLWWHLARHTLTTRHIKLLGGPVVALIVGLAIGLVGVLGGGLEYGLTAGLRFGLIFGSLSGLTVLISFEIIVGTKIESWLINEPAHADLRLKNRTKLLARRLAPGLGYMAGAGLPLGLSVGLMAGPVAGLIVGLAVGLMLGLMVLPVQFISWVGTPTRTDWATTPRSTYKATRTLTVLQTATVGLVFVLILGLGIGLLEGLLLGLVSGLMALATGVAAGLALLSSGAWLSYILTASQLATSRKLPLRIMDFLDDAYRLGLLRTTGSAYQFRHAKFQDHLLQTEKRLTNDRLRAWIHRSVVCDVPGMRTRVLPYLGR
ncbi:MAG: NACHT domain-containing protein [Pseudonocardiaceae bacterium]